MTSEQLSRTELLLGKQGVEKLQNSHVLIVGLGGVGGETAVMLARAGVGAFTLCDGDVVAESNCNRQAVAFVDTVGESKAEAAAALLRRINPDVKLSLLPRFIEPEDAEALVLQHSFDFIVDCIDSVASKVALLVACHKHKLPVVTSMGAGAKMDPSRIKIDDISRTSNCSLARVVRRRLIAEGIKKGITAVYSTENAIAEAVHAGSKERGKGTTVGTISYMPNLFGCFLASHVIRKLVEEK